MKEIAIDTDSIFISSMIQWSVEFSIYYNLSFVIYMT